MELAIFALFALLAVGSGVAVVAHRNPIYATMSLVVTLFSMAVLFVLLGAPFIAALQILIYAGAILVLFLFVLMLLNVQRQQRDEGSSAIQRWTALLGAALLCGMLAMLFWRSRLAVQQGPLTEQLVSLRGLASELFSAYLLPFEIIGLLLLVAVIGATVVARRPPPVVPGEPAPTGLSPLPEPSVAETEP